MHDLHARMTNMHLLAIRSNHNPGRRQATMEHRGTPAHSPEETVVKDLFNLPLPERLKRIRELAAEAEAFSDAIITPELRNSYLTIARHWRDLASQLENSAQAEPPQAPEAHSPGQSGEGTK
jgi:hypothetical protein